MLFQFLDIKKDENKKGVIKMKKKFTKIAALALGASLALGVVCFTACGEDGKSAYDIWLEQGNTGTEQDFLDSLKGTPGQPGNPGTPGEAPEITVGENGNWFVNGVDTKHKAQGDNGTPGDNGKDGNKITHSEGAPTSTEGAIEGDMYVDTKEWNVYFFESGKWKDYGCIKGADAGGEESPQYKVVKNFGRKTINTEEVSLDLNDVNNGTYFLVVECDSEAVLNNLTSVIGKTDNYDMYCPITKGYKSVVIKGDGTTLSLKATQSVTGNVKLIEYSAPTINAGETYEIPLIYNVYGRLHINLNSSLIGHKVKLEVKFYKQLYAIDLGYFTTDGDQYKQYGEGMFMADGSSEYVVNVDMTIASDMQAICIGGFMANTHCNGTVTVTLAD